MAAKSTKTTKKAAPLEVIYRKVGDLRPDPRNARKHSPQQVAELRASIRGFGFTNPILLRPSGIIGAGHGRLEAAIAEGMAEVPTITIDLPEAKWRALAIADNKIPLGATWDMEILGEELQAITGSGLDTVGLGFEELIPAPPVELEGTAKGTRVNQTVIHFDIVFDTEDQQAVWFKFVRDLKAKYPNEASLGARLALILPKVKL